MDYTITILLFGAGIVGGVINALAGGATLITFPAMIAAGLPPVTANASNAVAIIPGHLLAVVADRSKLPRFDRRLLASAVACVIGGFLGAVLLLAIPERYFILPVPALIGFATTLFFFAPRIAHWADARRNGMEKSIRVETGTLLIASIYGGFFGAGLGVILTAVLSISDPDDIRAVKALKNLLATCVSLTAVIFFIAQRAVSWHQTVIMLAGALVGGYLGGHLIRILPGTYVRNIVILAGALMTIIYAWKYWF